MATQRNDWKNIPFPKEYDLLDFDITLSSDEFELIAKGNKPQDMEDKWFSYLENNELYIHRSWSGICLFKISFIPQNDGHKILSVQVNRKPDEYGSSNINKDTQLVSTLLESWSGRSGLKFS